MTGFEQRDNSGSLFKNDRRETDKHPNYKGSVMVAGVEYWLSAWVKTSRAGTKFMSLSVKPKDEQRASAPARRNDDFDDSIEF